MHKKIYFKYTDGKGDKLQAIKTADQPSIKFCEHYIIQMSSVGIGTTIILKSFLCQLISFLFVS